MPMSRGVAAARGKPYVLKDNIQPSVKMRPVEASLPVIVNGCLLLRHE
ncbi:MAG TPA: hypothetical protein VER76_14750 [Pyrinomonadaceae bacterium]|nr:hypothetical protein [Pyrinomonadaceae bacterium]